MVTVIITVTGSSSLRLTWDPTQEPGATFSIYRGASNIQADAVLLAGPLPVGTEYYSDYTCQPATPYWYWLVDQSSQASGPATASTLAVQLPQEALGELQTDALAYWANSAFGGLYTAYWRYQAAPQPYSPRIVLNVLSAGDAGFDDSLDPYAEALIGRQVATISVQVTTNPNPTTRWLISATALVAGNYTLMQNLAGVITTPTVVFSTPPANETTVAQALVAILNDTTSNPTGLNAWLCGNDPQNQLVAVEPQDAAQEFSLVGLSNTTVRMLLPPSALSLAQRLRSSLADGTEAREQLSDAGIGVGSRQPVLDLSSMLETSAELVAQFDFYVNLASVYPAQRAIIDQPPGFNGTFVS